MSFIDWYESLEPHANNTKFYNKELLLRAWVAGSKSTRKWVGLTDEKVLELADECLCYPLNKQSGVLDFARAIEGTLKERNG